MIKIVDEISLDEFKGWCGAEDTLEKLKEYDLIDEVEQFIEDAYSDGLSYTELNDILRFDEWVEELIQKAENSELISRLNDTDWIKIEVNGSLYDDVDDVVHEVANYPHKAPFNIYCFDDEGVVCDIFIYQNNEVKEMENA